MQIIYTIFITILLMQCDNQTINSNEDFKGLWVLDSRSFAGQEDKFYIEDFSFWIKFLDNEVMISDTNKERPVWKYLKGNWTQVKDTILIDILQEKNISSHTGNELSLFERVEIPRQNMKLRLLINNFSENKLELTAIDGFALRENHNSAFIRQNQIEIGLQRNENFILKRIEKEYYLTK